MLIEALVVLFREKILSSAHGSLLFVLGLLLPVLWLLVEISGPLYYVRTHAYEIYEDRVEERVGLFSRSVTSVPLDQVRMIRLKQSVGGRILNYGDVEVSSISEEPLIRMRNIRSPREVKERLEEMVRIRGVGESRERPRAPRTRCLLFVWRERALQEEGLWSAVC